MTGSRRRRLVGLLAIAALGLAATANPVAIAGTPAADAAVPAVAAQADRVTLITGDVVTYTERRGADPEVAVQKAVRPRGRQVDILTEKRGDGFYVIPSDARPMVEAKTLDRELFNIRGLIAQGFADALPVIVRYPAGVRTAALPAAGQRPLPVVNGAAMEVRNHAAFWTALAGGDQRRLGRSVTTVHLDRMLTLSLDVSVPQIGAPEAWQRGQDGTGVTVAVLDSGIDQSHPDLAGQVTAATSFVTGETDPDDLAGHGTHVASTIAGTGVASGGRYKGVAPGASLLNGKVCNQYAQCAVSWILAGMDWAAHRGARVINMSLGGPATDGTDLVSETVNELTAETGALFVIAAGNEGRNLSVGTPGAAEAALTVGAVDKSDRLAEFSSRGPRLGDGGTKPEIVAPGVNIVAARATKAFPQVPTEVRYVGLQGTSMATPHVAGAAAIAAQARPGATAAELKNALTSTAKDTGSAWHEQGAGRLDIPAALDGLAGVSGPAGVSAGRIERDGGPHSEQLTYTNNSDADVTLRLGYAAKGWSTGDGAATLSAPELTVPAGGSASVTLTIDPAAGEPGLYGGVVTATGPAGVSLRTPLSWFTPYPPAPSHTMSIRMLDREGVPITPERNDAGTNVYVLRDESPATQTPNDPFASTTSMYLAAPAEDGRWTAELPPGQYTVLFGHIEVRHDERRVTLLSASEVAVSGDREVTLDGRRAVPSRANTGAPVYRYDSQTEIYARGGDAAVMLGWSTAAMENMQVYATPAAEPAKAALKIQQQFVLGDRFVRMQVRGRDLAAQFDPYLVTRELAGRTALPLVYAGAGTPEELARLDVRGRAVLIRLPAPAGNDWDGVDDASMLALTAAKNAAAAGARVALPYLDSPGALPTTAPYPKGPGTTVPIPVMSISHADGERLRTTAGNLRLDLQVERNPEAMYVLQYAADSGVPSRLDHRVDKRSLKHTRSRFHADVAGLGLFQWWWGYRYTDRISSSTNPYLYLQAPAEIDHYVGPVDSSQRWCRTSILTDGGDGRFEQQDETAYRGPVEDWFAGPLAPASPESPQFGYAGYQRLDGDRLTSTPFLTDSSTGHYAPVDWGVYPLSHKLYAEGPGGWTEVAPDGGKVPSYKLPADPGRYRMESTFTLPDSDWQAPSKLVRTMSPRVENVWTFRSARPAGNGCVRPSSQVCAGQPLLQLRYRLGLDLANRAAAGRPHLIGVTAAPAYGSIGGGQVTRLSVEYSTDEGRSWRRAPAVPTGGGNYLASLAHPRTPGGYVWLRTEAADSAGNTVKQTIHRAYALT